MAAQLASEEDRLLEQRLASLEQSVDIAIRSSTKKKKKKKKKEVEEGVEVGVVGVDGMGVGVGVERLEYSESDASAEESSVVSMEMGEDPESGVEDDPEVGEKDSQAFYQEMEGVLQGQGMGMG